MTIRETIDNAHRILDEAQWTEDYNHRHAEQYQYCRECGASFRGHERNPRHEEGCRLVATLRELDTYSTALQAKEDAEDGDGAPDPIEACAQMWTQRMEALERETNKKAAAAEARANKAERRLSELLDAARAFGYADDRFRKTLNENGVGT